MELNDIFLDRLPKIDLHGFDRDSARVAVNDFVEEACQMGYSEIVIIHGIGGGIVKEAVHQTLFHNKKVLRYRLSFQNMGCTVVELKKYDKFGF